MTLELRNLVDGEWVATGAVEDDRSPSDTRRVVARWHRGDAALVDRAVAAANEGAVVWSRSGIQQRHDVLKSAGDELIARADELGRLLADEEGKTLADGVAEVRRAGQIMLFFSGEAVRNFGEAGAGVRPGTRVEVSREPVGTVALICPWNFPVAIPAWKIAPALAYGNAVVLKPAEATPACAWALADVLNRAGLPPGVLNLVMGPGHEVGQALVDHRGVDAVSFTGSVATGRRVASGCAARLARFQLEMGGKNPLVVLDDADLDVAVDCALNGAFFQTGQRCTASSRLIVTDGVHDAFVAAVAERMRALRVGHALDPSTQIGPVVDERQLDEDVRYIEIGRAEGARLVEGGRAIEAPSPGHFLQPALFADVENSMRIAREEIFGPVAAVIRARGYEEALALANDTEFGLTAGICTTSLKHAEHFKRNAQAGMVMVNLPTAGVDYHVPFGGRKGSSHGAREQGRYAREFYTVTKTAYEAA